MSEEVKLPGDRKELLRAIGEALTGITEVDQVNAAKVAQMRFYVVAIPDSGDSSVHTFNSRDDMIIFLRGLDPHTSVRIFEGLRWQLLKGSPKRLQTPDGNGRLELFEYIHPEAIETEPTRPNEIGMHRVAFSVDDLDEALLVAARHGCHPLRGVATYDDIYRLTYVRGPSGIIVMLAEELDRN